MMRLTDKDALEDAVQGAINIMESNGINMIPASVPLAIIKGAPIIDAIPVEWLKAQIKNDPNDITAIYDDLSIEELIDKWRKEQKSQDAKGRFQ